MDAPTVRETFHSASRLMQSDAVGSLSSGFINGSNVVSTISEVRSRMVCASEGSCNTFKPCAAATGVRFLDRSGNAVYISFLSWLKVKYYIAMNINDIFTLIGSSEKTTAGPLYPN